MPRKKDGAQIPTVLHIGEEDIPIGEPIDRGDYLEMYFPPDEQAARHIVESLAFHMDAAVNVAIPGEPSQGVCVFFDGEKYSVLKYTGFETDPADGNILTRIISCTAGEGREVTVQLHRRHDETIDKYDPSSISSVTVLVRDGERSGRVELSSEREYVLVTAESWEFLEGLWGIWTNVGFSRFVEAAIEDTLTGKEIDPLLELYCSKLGIMEEYYGKNAYAGQEEGSKPFVRALLHARMELGDRIYELDIATLLGMLNDVREKRGTGAAG